MELFPLDALQTSIIYRTPGLAPHFRLSYDMAEEHPQHLAVDEKYRHRTELRVQFSEVAPANASSMVQANAAVRITEHLYGGVAEHLSRTCSALVEEGLPSNSPALADLSRLIIKLRGGAARVG